MVLIVGACMKKDRVDIWPLSPIYLVIYVIVIAFLLLFIILPFWLLIDDKPMNFFELGYVNKGFIQFLIMLPMSGFCIYGIVRSGIFTFKVSFTDKLIIAPKIPDIQDKKVEYECNQILTCEPTMEGLYYFFTFRCSDGKKRKIFITRFSFKQLERILYLIKERGGLQNQDIDEIINPLRIKKRKRKND